MHGNVYEWVQDCYVNSYNGAPDNEAAREGGNCDRRVLRGGSWESNPQRLRSAYRGRSTAGNRSGNGGFRLAQDL